MRDSAWLARSTRPSGASRAMPIGACSKPVWKCRLAARSRAARAEYSRARKITMHSTKNTCGSAPV